METRARVTFMYRLRCRAYTNKFAKRRLACASESPRTGKQSVESFTTARLWLSSGIKGNDVVRDVVMGGERVFQLELIIELPQRRANTTEFLTKCWDKMHIYCGRCSPKKKKIKIKKRNIYLNFKKICCLADHNFQ